MLSFCTICSFPDFFVKLTVVAERVKAENTPAGRISVPAVTFGAGHWD